MVALICGLGALAQRQLPDSIVVTGDSVEIYFRQSRSALELKRGDNQAQLERILDSIHASEQRCDVSLREVTVVGGASPEGSVRINRRLSEKRAASLFDYLSARTSIDSVGHTTHFLGRDWRGLIRLVEADPDVPYRDETLATLRSIADEKDAGQEADRAHINRIKRLRGGRPYLYMYHHLFPELRASKVVLSWSRAIPRYVPEPEPEVIEVVEVAEVVDTVVVDTAIECRPFYMDVSTNMLYDIMLIPSVGVEFYLGKSWSLAATWEYGWWKCDHRHNYWRAYGGDLELRRWFGKKSEEKPLTGHHAGVYGGIVTYDFELGHRGYLGDKWSYLFGVSYGYSMPVGRRLNIDFTIGLGYMGGKYKEYIPRDGCYVWQSTKQRHWFGPTKTEISLVWLIGCDNYNRKGAKKEL